jgi:ketosteroid isomerase-like protein
VSSDRLEPIRVRPGTEGESVARPVLGSYEALNRGDVEGTLAVLDEDVTWRESAELPGGGELRGRDAVGAFLAEFLETWERFDQRVTDAYVRGERVLAVLSMSGVGRASGVEVETSYAHLWTLRDGLAVRVDAYRDVAAARAAIEP